jgi:hypothetical protein
MGKGHEFDGFQPPEAPRHLDISAGSDERLILDTKRTRRPTAKAIVAIPVVKLPDRCSLYLARCFATAMVNALTIPLKHSSSLLPKPTSHKQALLHPLANSWMEAKREEYKSHDKNGT